MSKKDYDLEKEKLQEEEVEEMVQPKIEPEVIVDDLLVNFKAEVKVNVKFDFKTLKYANLYITNYKRKAYITNIIFSLVALGLGIFTFIQGQWLFGVIFIALAIMTGVQIFTMEKRIDQELYKYFAKHRVGNQDVSLSEELIVLTRPEDLIHPISYKWEEVNSIHEINEFYYIFTNRNRVPIIIDKNPELFEIGSLETLKCLLEKKIKESQQEEISEEVVLEDGVKAEESEKADWTEGLKLYFLIGLGAMLVFIVAACLTVLASLNSTNLSATYTLLNIFLILIEVVGVGLLGVYLYFRFKKDKVFAEKGKEGIKFVVVETAISKIPVTYVHKDDAIETAVADGEFRIKSEALKIEEEEIEVIVEEEDSKEEK